MGSLLHVHTASLRREQKSHWYLTTLAILCAFTSVGFTGYSLYTVTSYCRNRIENSKPDAPEPSPICHTPSPSQDADESRDQKENVTFTANPLR